MLEKPEIPDAKISVCLRDAFGIAAERITFLPLGADVNTAVYRVETGAGMPYFLKLRGGAFDDSSVELLKFFSDQGIRQIIAPLTTTKGQLRANFDSYTVILYPYVEGRDGYKVKLTEQQWAEFGAALKQIHTLEIPAELTSAIRREEFSPRWRSRVRDFLILSREEKFDDPSALAAASLLREQHSVILDLVERAEELSLSLRADTPVFVLCHSDAHAANVLIDGGGHFYIVDWDDPVMAPKERDLMFIGGAQGYISSSPHEEEVLFYRGYGQAAIDRRSLAYYRFERIIEDIAAYCQELLLSTGGGEDRGQSVVYLRSNFLPGGTIENAYRTIGM